VSTIKSSGENLKLSSDNTKDIELQHNGSTKVTVKSDGKVGVGTTSPTGNLTVKQSAADFYGVVIEESVSDAWLRMGHNGTVGSIETTYNASAGQTPLVFKTSGNEALRIDNGGNLLVGDAGANYIPGSLNSGTKVHVPGPISIGTGSSPECRKAGRRILGWYSTNHASGVNYTHISTSLWGGGSLHGNSAYIMGGFDIIGHRYATGSSVAKHTIFFHNWSGSCASGYSVTSTGNWNAAPLAYVNSSGYVTLRLPQGSYYGFTIDVYQFAHYPIRDILVTSCIDSNNTTI
jgi:hypothetical protein